MLYSPTLTRDSFWQPSLLRALCKMCSIHWRTGNCSCFSNCPSIMTDSSCEEWGFAESHHYYEYNDYDDYCWCSSHCSSYCCCYCCYCYHFMAITHNKLWKLRTEGFCWRKVLLPTCPCWWQLAHTYQRKMLEFSSVVLPAPSLYCQSPQIKHT